MNPDTATCRHLAAALLAHRQRVEHNGGAVPEQVQFLERLASFRVTQGQHGPNVDGSTDRPDDQGVTPRLLTYRQTADALGCSESKVKRLIKDGELTAVRIGGAARIRVGDLDAFVAELPATVTAGAA